MRPIRLELEGFTAYRELTLCDFDGVDLFVLTGPTGSGKSSLIDAMTFALYGSVSRYGNPSLVHPVISQGKLEAKVRFDFALGPRRYTAVRVVRRTRTGATTREARLESEGRTLAGSAEELTRRVRDLIGLNFEQFTTCVVLPQGEFARFLHEKPAERQDLLTKLLGVDLYERMGNLARLREADSRHKALLIQQELETAACDEAARKAARARLHALQEMKREVESAEPELEALFAEAQRARGEAEKLRREGAALETIQPPAGVSSLAEKIRRARASFEESQRFRVEAEEALASAEKRDPSREDEAALREVERSLRELEEKREGLERAEKESERAQERLSRAQQEMERASARERSSRERLEEVRRELASHDLRAHLEKGKPCPVCRGIVAKIPPAEIPPALTNAEKDAADGEKAHAAARRAWQKASEQAALARERLTGFAGDIAGLGEKLRGAPPPEELAVKLQEITRSQRELSQAREKAREARGAESRARKEADRLAEEERSAFRRFDEARDAVAFLGPPAAAREDLGEAWKRLRAWAQEELPRRRALAEKALQSAKEADGKRDGRIHSIAERGGELGIELDRERPRDGIVSALARAEQELARIEEAIARSKKLRRLLDEERERARVAGALGLHLRSTGFERWLLEEAFGHLVSGATRILKELSSGQYSFECDDRLNFEVVDHRNADERRSARTLSGGETFLASLALALTLAEQTAELAASGAARLESLFLDEGFGTLDDETLDVVAAAIAELGEQGRVVGVVTHQQNLAAMIPVQYRVSKNPATATVMKVEP